METASHTLHAFGDIVGYSRLNASQQEDSQDRFTKFFHASLIEAGVRPDTVLWQDQGDASLLRFPVDADVAKVLAVMPRRFNDDLTAHNYDAASHARLRVRLSFAIGPAAPGRTGLTGNAPIAVVRLSNSDQFRLAMRSAPQAFLGVIIDDRLYHDYIKQRFRSDLLPDEYVEVHVTDPGKDFAAAAWIKLFGCSAAELASSLAPGKLSQRQRAARNAAGRETATSQAASPAMATTGQESAGQDPITSDHRARRPQGGHRRFLNDFTGRVVAALIVGGLGLLGTVLALTSGGHAPGSHPDTGTSTPSPGTTGRTPADSSRTYTEYADWRGGVAVYSDNRGTATKMSPIPFNQGVQIVCVAQNDSGMSSIDSFYRIGAGPWKGAYASANEFTNGGPKGQATDPNIDPAIPPC